MKNGFSIFELLTVIVIMSIIATISVPVLINVIESAQKEAFILNITTFKNASELYIINNQNTSSSKEEIIINPQELQNYVSKALSDYQLFVVIKRDNDYYIILKDQLFETRKVTKKDNIIRYSLDLTIINNDIENKVIRNVF